MALEQRTERTAVVAVITGSTKGIGRAVAEALVRRGDRVVVSGRRAADAEAVAAEVAAGGPGEAYGLGADVRDPALCRALIDGAVERFGGIDVLVNNAGLGRFAPIQEMAPEDWDRQIRTNLDGAFYCSRAAVPYLITRGGGWILNIGSLAGKNAIPGGAAYNASKFGLLGLSEAMMLDLRHEGIRVSCVMPGSVNTHFFEGGPDPDDDWKLTAEDVARVVTDLISYPARVLPSRVEVRPSRPPQG